MMRPSIGSVFEMALPERALRHRVASYYDPTDDEGQMLPVSRLESQLRALRDEMAVHQRVLRPPIVVAEGSAEYAYAVTCLSVLRAMDGQLRDAMAVEAHLAMVDAETRRKRRFDDGDDLEAAFKRVRM